MSDLHKIFTALIIRYGGAEKLHADLLLELDREYKDSPRQAPPMKKLTQYQQRKQNAFKKILQNG